MYSAIESHFSRKSASRAVVEEFLRCGISVSPEGEIFAGRISLAPAKVARAIGVDRRVVISTAKQIASHEDLLAVFGAIAPRAYVGGCARRLGYDTIEISADDAHSAGIVSSVSGVLAREGITMRQIVADDPDLYPDPKLCIVVDGRLPPSALAKIRRLGPAEKITIR